MSMEWIRNYYGVPAQRGGRVEYTGCKPAKLGTIVSASNAHINVKLDGQKYPTPFHPTWELRYLDAAESATPAPTVIGENG